MPILASPPIAGVRDSLLFSRKFLEVRPATYGMSETLAPFFCKGSSKVIFRRNAVEMMDIFLGMGAQVDRSPV